MKMGKQDRDNLKLQTAHVRSNLLTQLRKERPMETRLGSTCHCCCHDNFGFAGSVLAHDYCIDLMVRLYVDRNGLWQYFFRQSNTSVGFIFSQIWELFGQIPELVLVDLFDPRASSAGPYENHGGYPQNQIHINERNDALFLKDQIFAMDNF